MGKFGICDVIVGFGVNFFLVGFLEVLNVFILMIGIIGELLFDWLLLKEKGIVSQGFDQLSFFKICSKEVYFVFLVIVLLEFICMVFCVVMVLWLGLVVLIILYDIFDVEWDENFFKIVVDDWVCQVFYLCSCVLVNEIVVVVELVCKVKCFVFVCGGGVYGLEVVEVVIVFVDCLQGFVVISLFGKGFVLEMCDYVVGVFNLFGFKVVIDFIKEVDFVIWCGLKVSQNIGMNWMLLLVEQVIIIIDFDFFEYGWMFCLMVVLMGDVCEMISVFNVVFKKILVRLKWMVCIVEVKVVCEVDKVVEIVFECFFIQLFCVMYEIVK